MCRIEYMKGKKCYIILNLTANFTNIDRDSSYLFLEKAKLRATTEAV